MGNCEQLTAAAPGYLPLPSMPIRVDDVAAWTVLDLQKVPLEWCTCSHRRPRIVPKKGDGNGSEEGGEEESTSPPGNVTVPSSALIEGTASRNTRQRAVAISEKRGTAILIKMSSLGRLDEEF